MSSIYNRRILCDFWYFRELDDLLCPFEKYAEEKLGPRLARFFLRISVLRALLLIWLGRDFPLIAPDWFRYGRLICVLQAILRNRNIVIFECIDIAVWKRGRIIGVAILFLYKYVIGPSMRASVVAMHVFTNREKQIFMERFGLPEDMLHTLQWPLWGMDYSVKSTESSLWHRQLDTAPVDWDSEVHDPIGSASAGYVLASGYNSCDWKTLFEAARFGKWPLVVACANEGDIPLVTALNTNGRAKVLTKVNAADHNRLVIGATIYALCLKENLKSNGQGRLAEAIAAGVPVVASNVLGLEGSLIDGVTAIAVEPGNPAALARAIETLLHEPDRRNALAAAAKKHAVKFSKEYYFSELRQLLSICLDNHR